MYIHALSFFLVSLPSSSPPPSLPLFLPPSLPPSLQGVYGAIFIKFNILWTKLRKRRFNKFPMPLIEVCAYTLLSLFPRPPTPLPPPHPEGGRSLGTRLTHYCTLYTQL